MFVNRLSIQENKRQLLDDLKYTASLCNSGNVFEERTDQYCVLHLKLVDLINRYRFVSKRTEK